MSLKKSSIHGLIDFVTIGSIKHNDSNEETEAYQELLMW